MAGLTAQDFDSAYYFSKDGLKIYHDSLSITTMESSDRFVNKVSDIITEKLLEQSDKLTEYENYNEYLTDYKNEEYSVIDGEISFEDNDSSDLFLRVFSVYFFIILIYVLISQYASYVTISISNEKTSKTMESLIASTSTNSLVFGKVAAVFCGSVIQVLLIVLVLFISSNIGYSSYNNLQDSLASFQDLEGVYMGINQIFDPTMIVYFFFLAMAGFLMYLFIFATLASTISKVEDISSSVQLGTVIFMLAFFDAIGIIFSPTNKFIVSLAYFPLFTPLSMMAKYASGMASTFDIVYSIIISLATVVFLGFFAGRCYKVGVLYYGSKPTFKKLISMFVFNK